MTDEGLPVIARFEVRRRSYLGPDGSVLRPLPAFASDTATLVSLYRGMVLTRAFDLKAVSLQRTGRLGTYAVSLGQEAVSVGIASAMRREDVVLPSYRDNGTLLWRGTKMEEILLFWGGDERGNQSSGPAHDFPYCIPVGSQAPHAAGVAYAFRLRKEPRVVVCLFGDGATSKGDVWEAMNFAGVHKLPVVFVCENNRFAYSTPLEKQMAIDDVASRAAAYGFKGHAVSGNDLLAVVELSERVMNRTREGGGPALIECKTYRYRGHSEHDPALYRDKEELLEWEARDPIPQYEFYLEKKGHDLKRIREEVDERVRAAVQAAVDYAEQSPLPRPEEALEDLYAPSPPAVSAASSPPGGGNHRGS